MDVRAFHDAATDTITYVVHDPATGDAVVLDPVLDFDPASGRVGAGALEPVLAHVADAGLTVRYLLETHAHADHLSGAQVLKRRWPRARLAIGARITDIQRRFREVFGHSGDFPVDGRQWDRLLEDGEQVEAGSLAFEVIATPGHTPACVSYRFEGAVFTGDALFMPDMGTGRCDFPGGSAEDLYRSVHERLYALPEDTRVFVGHDYRPGGRDTAWESTVGRQRRENVHLRAETTREAFVALRTARDRTLGAPRLLLPSLQVNIDAGRLPPSDERGRRRLVLPLEVDEAAEAAAGGDLEAPARRRSAP